MLRQARDVLERYSMFDDEDCRGDVSEICLKIDDAISDEADEADAAA